MDELWKIIIAVIAGFGGTAGLIILIVKWASGLITEKIQKDYDLKLEKKLASYKAEIDKELEKHRSALGNKNYITQKKFDVEFEMYQELAEKYYNLVKEASTLIPTGLTHVPADKKVREAVDEQTERWDVSDFRSKEEKESFSLGSVSKINRNAYSMQA